MYSCLCFVEPYRLYSPAVRLAAASMHARIWLATFPPPIASNASVAPVSTSASVSSSMNVGDPERQYVPGAE